MSLFKPLVSIYFHITYIHFFFDFIFALLTYFILINFLYRTGIFIDLYYIWSFFFVTKTEVTKKKWKERKKKFQLTKMVKLKNPKSSKKVNSNQNLNPFRN